VVTAVTGYEVSVALHIAAAVIAFGPTFVYPIIQKSAENAAPRSLPFALRLIKRIDNGVVNPVAVVVGLTGVYQWTDGNWDIGENQWLAVGLALYLGMFAVALWVFRSSVMESAAREAESCIESAGPSGEVVLSDQYRAIMRLPDRVGPLLGLSVLVIIYLMVVKPF
jgi:uncharacterized membrane protein